MTINWITPRLGTGPIGLDALPTGSVCVDVRHLVDRGGNSPALIRNFVEESLRALGSGNSVVICCDHGISRSNALAVAVLSRHEGISIAEALSRVLIATSNAEIRLDVLDAIRLALEEGMVGVSPTPRERWLLTGAFGYLGSALASGAIEGMDLICPTHSQLDLTKGAAGIDLFVRRHHISGILHFAAPHVGNINSSLGETITVLRNVLDVCASNDLRLLLPSRWEVFSGYLGVEIVADENTVLKPSGVLGDTKFLSERLVEIYVERSGIRALILRSGLIYGGSSGPNFLRSFAKRAVAGQNVCTHQYTNGEAKLDLLHVNDWIDACRACLIGDLQGVYNCGTGRLVSTGDIARSLLRTMGALGDVAHVAIHASCANVALGSAKLTKAVGWKPRVCLEDGISDFVMSYIRTNTLKIVG